MPVPAFKSTTDNVIEMRVVNRKLEKKEKIRYNKDGSISKWKQNKVAGVSSEVYPFTSKDEINAMIDVFNKRIEDASDENKRQIACRNKMLFLIGINIGLRASDLCILKFNHLLNDDGSFKDYFSIQPKKTKKTGKYVKPFINEAIVKAVINYLNEYPVFDFDEYLFKSRKGNTHITENSLGVIIKDAAAEAGIDKNICSHTLRKTFGFWAWHNAKDKNKALVTLQSIFNHSSTQTTMKYIGLLDSEMEDVFNSIDLGLDYI